MKTLTVIGSLLAFLLIGTSLSPAQELADESRSAVQTNGKYAQIYLPPVSYVGPPVIVGPPIYTTTYYNPPIYINNSPVLLPPGPMIIRYPGRPFLRTFIP